MVGLPRLGNPPMTLRNFLTRLIWLCVLPPLLLAAGLAVEQVRQLDESAARQAQVLAQEVADAIDADLSERLGALRLLAQSPLIDDLARWESFRVEAQRLRDLYDMEVVLVDRLPTQRLHTQVPAGQSLPPLPHGESIRRVFEGGQHHVTPVGFSQVQRRQQVWLAVPVLRPGRATEYAVLGATPLTRWQQALEKHALPAGWHLDLRDAANQTIAQLGQALGAKRAARRFEAKVSSAPWMVRLEVPPESFRDLLWRSAGGLGLALLAATALALAAGTWGSRRLQRAMRTLVDPEGTGKPVPAIAEVTAARSKLSDTAVQLELHEAQLRAILDNASDGVITTDGQQRIVMANPAALRMFGYPAQGLIGQPLDRLIPERLREQHRSHLQHFGATGQRARPMGGSIPLPAVHADGQEFPIEASISHVRLGGQEFFTVIVRDISERLRVQAELENSHRDLQRLLAAQDKVQETERLRIAAELHDELQQTMAAILIEGAAARQAVGKRSKLCEPLDRIEQLASAAIVSTRRIINGLRPQMLEELGLEAALQAMALRFEQLSGARCRFEAVGLSSERAQAPSPAVANCLYRVTQEALNNVAKHARARQVQVRLEALPSRRLTLQVSDDGQGLGERGRIKPDAFGLLSLRERVRALGGVASIRGVPGEGTTVTVELPARAEPAA